MAGNTLKLEIITPEAVTISTETSSVILIATDGSLGIWPNHAPMIAGLRPGVLRYSSDQGEQFICISGGFVEVSDNVVSVIAPAAEKASEIDIARATAAKDRAEDRLAKKEPDIDVARAKIALAKALARLDAAQKVKH